MARIFFSFGFKFAKIFFFEKIGPVLNDVIDSSNCQKKTLFGLSFKGWPSQTQKLGDFRLSDRLQIFRNFCKLNSKSGKNRRKISCRNETASKNWQGRIYTSPPKKG